MTEHHAYATSLKVGVLGVLLITLYGAIAGPAAALPLLTVWLLLTLFAFPWLVLFIENELGDIPDWFIRGPHQ